MKFETPAQKVSYLIGRQVGDQLKGSQFPGFELDGVVKGIQDSMAGEAMPFSQEEIQEAYQVIQAELEKMQAEAAEQAKAVGDEFLAENAKKEGVQVTDSGLQYEVISEGSGATPSKENTVRVHYHGTFIDGRMFDSSVERGEPAEFPVGGVIAGWTEALQLMKEGDKWRLTVPSELAYGAQGSQGAIPPHSVLVFEVELLNVL
ncbi:FKBP-type peptidyl-prolyl cis-trans isomerase [Bermanella marisrubri]|uniref:Peptidyl-prolyl cis-trans isomerase n=1 Tax=Bermanella marisrubri TaxID=207949 RepID=Q1N1V3_9GAMM|nr:FKBP-type peptidyl-prolyl cis-trans isomerase [Bermanella marisrubri]EAT12178.1 FKBP-type peptidyl-prolyl cis-trans isomerase FklB [Oceanobacter sp. RED65] [Bermanella marisrubri]QIZ83652.1 FKBP-type peptidyl-prolyl cis-trans isomerase [Bermanella marisrubri]